MGSLRVLLSMYWPTSTFFHSRMTKPNTETKRAGSLGMLASWFCRCVCEFFMCFLLPGLCAHHMTKSVCVLGEALVWFDAFWFCSVNRGQGKRSTVSPNSAGYSQPV